MAVIPGDRTPSDRADAISYLATMLQQLAPLAERNGLDVLAYLLSMAQLEAETILRQTRR